MAQDVEVRSVIPSYHFDVPMVVAAGES